VKTCTGCKETKPLTEFFRDKRKKNGLMARCKHCKTQSYRQWKAANPGADKRRYWTHRDSERERHLVKKYGVTFARYAELLSEQGGCCVICRRPEPDNRMLDVDHDHDTGVVRGLLCTSCNRVLGHAHDSEERLRAAADYLSSRKSRKSSSKRT
jgi:hypothetical protein